MNMEGAPRAIQDPEILTGQAGLEGSYDMQSMAEYDAGTPVAVEADSGNSRVVKAGAVLGGALALAGFGYHEANQNANADTLDIPVKAAKPNAESYVATAMDTGKVVIPKEVAARAQETTETPDASASATQNLGHNALKKICVREGMKKPKLVTGELHRSNERRSGVQGWSMNEAVWLLPAKECNGEFKRLTWVKSEVRNRGKGWRTSIPWSMVIRTNKGVLGDKSDPNSNVGEYNNTIDAGQLLYVDTDSPKAYKCGGNARIKMKNRVKDLDTGKFVAGRQWTYKAKVKPAC